VDGEYVNRLIRHAEAPVKAEHPVVTPMAGLLSCARKPTGFAVVYVKGKWLRSAGSYGQKEGESPSSYMYEGNNKYVRVGFKSVQKYDTAYCTAPVGGGLERKGFVIAPSAKHWTIPRDFLLSLPLSSFRKESPYPVEIKALFDSIVRGTVVL
jgi:hypothetical protein